MSHVPISIVGGSVQDGQVATFQINVGRKNHPTLHLNYSTFSGTAGSQDYVQTSGTVTISKKARTATVKVQTLPDSTFYAGSSRTFGLSVAKHGSAMMTINGVTPIPAPVPVMPTINWPTPAEVVYGTPLSGAQLDAAANVPGTFTYSPTYGSILPAGNDQLSVTFTPNDTKDFTTATERVNLAVAQATPKVSWPIPASIVYGTPLSGTQLNATANVPGTFIYSPASGFVLSAGSDTLSVTFTPNDSNDYTSARASVNIAVAQITPMINWPTPAGIIYGTALSSTQLDATASVPGTFFYSPAVGTDLPAGNDTLRVTFTPSDITHFRIVTDSVIIAVAQATPTVNWSKPATIAYGTALSSTQLDATANMPGTFTYSPAAGAVLPAIEDNLSVTFTPTDINYKTVTVSTELWVNPAIPTISWPIPAAITYGTALSSTQLDATTNIPGTFSYSTAAGTVLPAGDDILSAVFTPTDDWDYSTVNVSAMIHVQSLTPPTTPTSTTRAVFAVSNVSSGKYLESDLGQSTVVHSEPMYRNDLNWTRNQDWDFVQLSDGNYNIIAINTGLYVSDYGDPGTFDNGMPVVLEQSSVSGQEWKLIYQTNGSYEIVNASSGMYLQDSSDPNGYTTENIYTGAANQQWMLNTVAALPEWTTYN
jgi:hypothetical protein